MNARLENTLALLESPEHALNAAGCIDFMVCLQSAPLPEEFVERIFKLILTSNYVGYHLSAHFGEMGPTSATFAPALAEALNLPDDTPRHAGMALASLGPVARPVVDSVVTFLDQSQDEFGPWSELIQVVRNSPPYDHNRIRSVLSRLFVRFEKSTDCHKDLLYSLGEVGEFALPALLEALPSSPSFFIETIGRLSNATAAFSTILRYAENPDTRGEALDTLISIGIINADVERLIRKMLIDPNCIEGHFHVFKAMLHLGPKAAFAIPELLTWFSAPYPGEMLSDGYLEELRELATRIVGRVGPLAYRAIPYVAAHLLRSKSAESRKHAAEALSRMGPDAIDCIPALRAAVDLEASGETKLSEQQALRELERWVHSGEECNAVYSPIHLLSSPYDTMTVPLLRKDITINASDMRNLQSWKEITRSVRGLSSFGPNAAEASPELAALLAHSSDEVSYNAMDALAQIGRAAVESILPFTRHPAVGVQIKALWVLGRIGFGSDLVVEALRTGLRSADNHVRWHAVWSAKCMPSVVKALAVDIRRVSEDTDLDIGLHAKKALASI